MHTDLVGWQTPQSCALSRRAITSVSRTHQPCTKQHNVPSFCQPKCQCAGAICNLHISWEGSIARWCGFNQGLYIITLSCRKLSASATLYKPAQISSGVSVSNTNSRGRTCSVIRYVPSTLSQDAKNFKMVGWRRIFSC